MNISIRQYTTLATPDFWKKCIYLPGSEFSIELSLLASSKDTNRFKELCDVARVYGEEPVTITLINFGKHGRIMLLGHTMEATYDVNGIWIVRKCYRGQNK